MSGYGVVGEREYYTTAVEDTRIASPAYVCIRFAPYRIARRHGICLTYHCLVDGSLRVPMYSQML